MTNDHGVRPTFLVGSVLCAFLTAFSFSAYSLLRTWPGQGAGRTTHFDRIKAVP